MIPRRLKQRRLAAAAVIGVLTATTAWAVHGNEPAGPAPGYLGRSGLPDDSMFLPPPPAEGSVAGDADLARYRVARGSSGTDRWLLAQKDNSIDPASMLSDFGCALGITLKPGDLPAMDRLLQRSTADVLAAIGPPKDRYRRARPFVHAGGETCVPATPELAASGSYPSGHATLGWAYGLILAEMAPDRASPLIARGRAIGESRIVCGVHYPSDIEAGRMLGAALVAALHSDEEFKADIALARAEFAAAKAARGGPEPAHCPIERSTLAATPGH